MQYQQHEPFAATPLCIFEHLPVAIRVAEGGNRPASNVLMDADWLAMFIVNEVQFRQTQKNRLTIAHVKLCLDAAADDLFGWDPVNCL